MLSVTTAWNGLDGVDGDLIGQQREAVGELTFVFARGS